MVFPVPEVWTRDTADARRDEEKRQSSPCSFFYSQGRSLVLAAEYFVGDRLAENARGGVALKHRHRIHLSLFGQLMASFEYLLKDFVAKAIDLSPLLDDAVQKAKWITVDAGRVLANRFSATTPGSMLVHSTLGWHTPSTANSRYGELFQCQPIANTELSTLERLWVLRHTVAHNAGFVIHYDASRIGTGDLAERVADINAAFIADTFGFLNPIAKRVAEDVGDKVLLDWMRMEAGNGLSYERDGATYASLKKLATFTESCTRDVPTPGEAEFNADLARALQP